jgi:hypothetical protein
VYRLCTLCVPVVLPVCTSCVTCVYQLCYLCVPVVLPVCTGCVHCVYRLCTLCVPVVYTVCTGCVTLCVPVVLHCVYRLCYLCVPVVLHEICLALAHPRCNCNLHFPRFCCRHKLWPVFLGLARTVYVYVMKIFLHNMNYVIINIHYT